ncbi:group II intron reverse transcriptase/maturase [Marispirochaeta sp.]|uniref:group II intron reverse transcriptase/maturase n=1 Tax=Marispirochaeta sp. TaxID=2038653 RepID=UPI0029C91B60|nr:group II intron reverse transcriptase/maturase [Marispirochaeta sp.]
MNQYELAIEQPSLFESLCTVSVLQRGFKAVKRNGGSPGIDGVKIQEFERNLNEELLLLQKELAGWTYKPKPVRRVEIPKPGPQAGVRLLGVPCIRDRVVQAAIKYLLEPLYEPQFSDSSYGFRPHRSQKQAVAKAKALVQSGKEYVVDIDLSKFFDRVNHDRLIRRLSETIQDKRILRLIGETLRSGVMNNGVVSATQEGTTQGSPLSPLLSNVVLDELDKELERRGLEFCRYADDSNIFVKTEKAAQRVMASITKFIEGKLKLKINRGKSKVALSRYVKFLGMTIIAGTIAISAASINRAMERIKELTPRGTRYTLEQTIQRINQWYSGWASYYGMTQYPAQLRNIEAHVRRRLRARIIDQQKRRRHVVRTFMRRGVSETTAKKAVYSNKKRWALSKTMAAGLAFPNTWFIETMGQIVRSDDDLPHWFTVKRWIKLT